MRPGRTLCNHPFVEYHHPLTDFAEAIKLEPIGLDPVAGFPECRRERIQGSEPGRGRNLLYQGLFSGLDTVVLASTNFSATTAHKLDYHHLYLLLYVRRWRPAHAKAQGVQHENGKTVDPAARKRRSQGGLPAPADKASTLFQRSRWQAAAYGRALFSAGAIRSHVIPVPVDLKASLGKHWFVELVQHLHSLPHEKIGLIPNMEPSSSQHFELRSSKGNSKRSPEDREEPELQSKKPKIDRKGKQKERVDSQGSLTHASTESFVFPMFNHPPPNTPLLKRPPLLSLRSTRPLLDTRTRVKRVLRVTQVIFRSDGLVEGIGRGTTVLEVKCIEEEVVETAQRTTVAPEESWKGQDLILKVSFPPSERRKESVLIDTARAHAETHDAQWALQHLPRVVASVDSLDWESNDPNENTLQNRLKSQFGDAYETRSLRATVLEKLEPLSNLKSAREFAQVFYDILQIHRWLYDQSKILHRDLSMANIMFRRKGDQVYGVLNDFDLSSLLTRMDKSPTSKHRTGTKPFMARDLLDLKWDKGHLYRLESLFYIIPILSCHYTDPTTRASSLPFADWFDGLDQFLGSLKLDFLQSLSTDLPVQTYFNGFTQWLLTIREMLDEGYKSRPRAFSRSVKNRIRALLYNWETLNGHVTYLQIMEVMRSFDGEELSTRWDGGSESR
ncbi:hypothetical protein D9757_011039 [Collybiopsis confluens]|uniref:Protein kinase domain-containing protein n=1 Tax=Collybiopsis confluens TaxID=2823264 RepID=A0A8H5GIS8_9AGAR|nr:hypothetical protein D9757_011039 [Collybiopsis confluens]